MPEFGHVAKKVGISHIDYWGAGPFLMPVNGTLQRFEDSDRFGPWKISAAGDVLDRQWGERHPFWTAYGQWVTQGRRLQDDGQTCIWDPPKATIATRITRRHLMVVSQGDEGGEIIVRDPAHLNLVDPVVHFVGFRGEEYWSAVRIWGRPHFIHRGWDRRAQREIVDGEIVIFATGDEHQTIVEHNFNDFDEKWL